MGKRTPLHPRHIEAGAKMVDFAGWDMPIHYGSLMDEHRAVREDAGVFDVSHMNVVDVGGPHATAYLQFVLANDVGRLASDGALYSAMLNEEGGVIDDLIVYRIGEDFRLVLNCATRDKDLAWLRRHAAGRRLELRERPDFAILAVHGPRALDKAFQALGTLGLGESELERIASLGNFRGMTVGDCFVAHTGYTGEKGLEVMLPAERAVALWDAVLAVGVHPVGLGARDTLRLEAGMNLYGHDMDEGVTPFSANMARTVAWEPSGRDFIGRDALERLRGDFEQGRLPLLTGLVLDERGVPREGQSVLCETDGGPVEGVVTSGTFSPTLKQGIALARLPAGAENCRIDLRGKPVPARVVKPPFVRHGRKVFE